MIKTAQVMDALRQFGGALRFGGKSPIYREIDTLKEAREKLKTLATTAKGPQGQAMVSGAIRKLDVRIMNTMAQARKMEQEHAEASQVMKATLGMGAAGAIGAGSIYGMNKLQEPDMGNEFKLAADQDIDTWVAGFVEKCAEYGVDGAALLDQAVDAMCSGETKNAQGLGATILKNYLPKIIGAGAAGFMGKKLLDTHGQRTAEAEKLVPQAMKDVENVKKRESQFSRGVNLPLTDIERVRASVADSFNSPWVRAGTKQVTPGGASSAPTK
jgi:hypothetical protein